MDVRQYKQLVQALERRVAGVNAPVQMPGADLRGADLWRADLVNANLREAKLEYAGLVGAKLGGAVLAEASLKGANLNGADMQGASLAGADLDLAAMEGTRLAGADLRGASLRAIKGEPSSYAKARIDLETVRRSGWTDGDVIQLWRAGAELEPLEAFSAAVRRAVSGATAVAAEAQDGPSPRQLAESFGDDDEGPVSRRTIAFIEQQMKRALVIHDTDEAPSSKRAVDELRKAMSMPPPASAQPASTPDRPSSPGDRVSLAPVSMPMVADPAHIQAHPAKYKSLAPGKSLLGVELQQRVGGGNAASVWRALDASGGRVAVKVFDPARPQTLSALARGVHTMSRLMLHGGDAMPPSIARLRCVSVNELCFTTDAAAGNLRDVPALRWPVPKIVRLVAQIAEAVAWAHDAGVLHRCLKPSNVLLVDDFQPIVTDFDMVDLPLLRSEQPADIGGYGPYAAPEEVLDLSMRSPTADVFSLGRLLYFLLAGRDPDEPLVDVPRLASIDREQPAGLVRIIRKCTMLDPAARYQWVSELLEDLANYERHDEVGIKGIERNFLWHRISTVVAVAKPPPQPPEAEVEPEIQLPDAVRKEPAAPLVSRRAQAAVAGVCAAVVVVTLAAMLGRSPPPAGGTLQAMREVIVVAVGVAFFALWRQKEAAMRARVAAGLGAALLVGLADPARLIGLRAKMHLHTGDPGARAEAVRVAARAGRLDMRGLDMSGLDLSKADLSLADLRGVNLSRSSLRSAGLREAKLDGADMTDAIIEDADLARSDAPSARGWPTTLCSYGTRLPKGWVCSRSHHPVVFERPPPASPPDASSPPPSPPRLPPRPSSSQP